MIVDIAMDFCLVCTNCLFRSRHGVIFDTLGPLLTLLRSGAQDAYRQFFMDCMLVVEGKEDMKICDKLNTFFCLKCHCLKFVKLS